MDREAACDAEKCLVNFQANHDFDGHETGAGSITQICLPGPILWNLG